MRSATVGSVMVLVPIYKSTLDPLELYSLEASLAALHGRHRDIRFIGPRGLDVAYYAERFSDIPFLYYDPAYFESIVGYNRLLLNPLFYSQFDEHEFILILQTDAIVLRDDLDHWCSLPFDYVGAPWPDGVELFVNACNFGGSYGKRLKVHVGNGGLSLRRVRKCTALLREFAEAVDVFCRTGSSEDLFFSFMGALSRDFIIPNEIMASLFALELKPSYYYAVNGGTAPMGGHAWWKYEPNFWQKELLVTPVPL